MIDLTEGLLTLGCKISVETTDTFQASLKKQKGLTIIATINEISYKTPYAIWIAYNKTNKTWSLTKEENGLSLPLETLKQAFIN